MKKINYGLVSLRGLPMKNAVFIVLFSACGVSIVRDFSIVDFGGVGDGKTDCTTAFAKAVDGGGLLPEQIVGQPCGPDNVPPQFLKKGANEIFLKPVRGDSVDWLEIRIEPNVRRR